MGLVICVSNSEALKASKLYEQICSVCEDVVSNDSQLLFIPQAGKLMAVLEMFNEEGIDYHFQHSKDNQGL